ncbi:HesA/MoeB/ThiF family protein [Paracoccus siganidrum]|uniref:Molybdopterin-synthase adenylyltransferase n=1 Tax=Paracoccus siganidrum TaxID=1276757 RepID=A0A418ZVH8_9RHOB|nr:molybdopterin-synthase adenylyltransferase MoeB [Paracoccus siganidrum]RJL03969.1 molybdopterin-synthase adenylyltransferase MoeB [Paracoccus siganidrum]RMC34001.1 molybdopterin biosynthesis protein [Paracoccus siganidrum]
MLGLALLAGLGALALLLRLPGRVAALAALLLWAGILLLHGLAPNSPAARALGGDLRIWLVAGGAALLVLAYRAGLRRLRAGAIPVPGPEPAAQDGMSDAELDRYARHLVLREIGGPGQMRLRGANVLVVGAGGLGAPVCLYLAAAGVGRITLADDDTVGLSNLQRQVIFRADQRGQMKSRAAAANMGALNPHVAVTALERRITEADTALVAAHDLVLDGTDSFASREVVNRLCVRAGVPLIAGAIAQWEGQVTLYDPARGGPCMACLFPQAPAPGLAPPCAEAGVIGPLPGVVGSLMALEAIKHLAEAGQGLRGRMLIFDGLYGESRMIGTNARPDCPVCGGGHFVTGT